MRHTRPRQLDYASVTLAKGRVSIYGYCGLALVVVQVFWVVPWALFQRWVFADGEQKKPLGDFFIELGIAAPTVGILCLGIVRCSIELRRTASLRGCVHWLWVLGLASTLVALVVIGWFIDDVIHVNTTR